MAYQLACGPTRYRLQRYLMICLPLVLPQSIAHAQADAEILTNASVVQMIASRLPRDLVTAKINTARPGYDLSAAGLVFLTVNRVDQNFIKSMISAAESARSRGDAPNTLLGLDEILTNDLIVSMVVGKVPKPLIFGKIQSSKSTFDVSSTGLVKLNENKVPQDIIKAMMLPPPPPPIVKASIPVREAATNTAIVAPPTHVANEVSPAKPSLTTARVPKVVATMTKIPTEPGIYMYSTAANGAEFEPLEKTVYTAGKTSGGIPNAITGGLAKVKMRAVVRGAEASMATSDASVEFYFVFEKQTPAQNSMAALYPAATSPNEFSLVRMDVKSDSRELVVGSVNAIGSESGTEGKANVPFKSTRLKTGVYRVIPVTPLAPGQYAFLPPAIMPVAGNAGAAGANRLYDFMVK